jgi:poly-gamma-glutamate synthesis protein (capsule biosynthesis protein)
VRIAWVAASQFSFPHAAPDPAQPSVAMATAEALRQQVLAARAQADVVVLSLHWGEEYRASATKTQRELARVALEAGADVILGHHSHVLGPIEERESGGRKRLVAYSLGNLVFDSPPWNRAAHRSVLLHLEVSKRGLRSWKITPLQIQNGRPRVAGGRR